MAPTLTDELADLYEADETAWLETMVELVEHGDIQAMDMGHLALYLRDLARRDRRQVFNRLVVLMAHRLKWLCQPSKRSRSWLLTMERLRQDLCWHFESATLRNHAEASLTDAYDDAVDLAAVETGLPESAFPPACPFSLDDLAMSLVVDEPLAE